MTDKLQSRMSAYFLAGFPCMYMDSVEDLRAVQHVRSMASEAAEEAEVAKPYQVVVWRATTGLNKVEGSMEMGKETQLQIPDTVDLRQALSWVSSQSDDDPTACRRRYLGER